MIHENSGNVKAHFRSDRNSAAVSSTCPARLMFLAETMTTSTDIMVVMISTIPIQNSASDTVLLDSSKDWCRHSQASAPWAPKNMTTDSQAIQLALHSAKIKNSRLSPNAHSKP